MLKNMKKKNNKKSFKKRYEKIVKSKQFKNTYLNKSIGNSIKIDE